MVIRKPHEGDRHTVCGRAEDVAYRSSPIFCFILIACGCRAPFLLQASKVALEAKCREQAQLNQLTVEHAKTAKAAEVRKRNHKRNLPYHCCSRHYEVHENVLVPVWG